MGDSKNPARTIGHFNQLKGYGRLRRQRLFAEHVTSRSQCREDVFPMQSRRRCHQREAYVAGIKGLP